MKQRVFISNSIDEEKLPFISAEAMKYGKAHYSWKIIANLYTLGLQAANFDVQTIVRPEIYQSTIAHEVINLKHDDVHIAVKPIEHIRPFHGIKNIFICGWEFPEFSTTAYNSNIFLNHIAILKRADQIWCWSDFAVSNLQSYGIDMALTMPPPVLISKSVDEQPILDLDTVSLDTTHLTEVSQVKQLGAVLEEFKDATIFFTVLNPFDRRKQFRLMLTSFMSALKQNPNMILIVKLVIDNVLWTLVDIQDVVNAEYISQPVKCDRIIFVGDTLTDSQMIKLAKTARFYLSTSSAEGLNLPLIESMYQGIVPVSTNATAMADYISEENAIVIRHGRSETQGLYHSLHEYLRTTHFPPDQTSVEEALLFASTLSPETYQSLSDRAKSDVYAKYSIAAFVGRLSSSLATKRL